jgi:hypothetical protein
MIQLETYKGTRTRHTCPVCGCKNQFTRFVDDAGNYLADDVGICNRASKCGYRYTAKQFFADNPTASNFHSTTAKHTNAGANRARQTYTFVENKTQNPQFDFIAPEHLKSTLGNYDRNAFVQFLFDLFPDCSEEIQSVLKMYFVGTYEDYTCFPQIDRLNRVCKAKLIRFNRATGKRLKDIGDTSSLKTKLKLKKDFNYKQIFFGEHLLRRGDVRPVAVVESEKTAIVASLCMPRFVWLATGSKQWLKAERLQKLDNRQIILYPDADGFDHWKAVATDAQRQSVHVKASALIENFATSEQKQNQYDLADYLIEQQTEIHAHNWRADNYNYKLDKILNDESLFAVFNSILDEQKAIAIYNGATEAEAERLCTQADYVRFAVRSV